MQSELGNVAEVKQGEDAKVSTTLKGSMGERINKALAKVEEKKQKRAQRREQVGDFTPLPSIQELYIDCSFF
jgi:hypothetical protein